MQKCTRIHHLLKPYINGCFVADAQKLDLQTLVLFINAGVDEGNTRRLFIVEDRNHISTKHLPEKLKVFEEIYVFRNWIGEEQGKGSYKP